MALPLVFDFYNSIIEVPAPDITLDLQYLINQIRDNEDNLNPGIAYAKIADASGKDDLGGSVYTAITVRLLDSWRVRFEARLGPDTVQCTISGGNLVGGLDDNPVAPSTYTQVLNLSSSAGTISYPTTTDTTNLGYLVASLTGSNKGFGNIYYWDPTSGDNANDGLSPSAAKATFSATHDLVTAGNHDIIFCLSTHTSGITTVTETLSITKATTKVKGPGYTFQLIPNASGSDTISVTAGGVEVSGLYISTYTSGTDDALSLTGNLSVIKDCWITTVRSHGITISSAEGTEIINCVVEDAGESGTGNGINLGNSSVRTKIANCIVYSNVDGIALSGTSIADNTIDNCLIYQNSDHGIDIGSGVDRTMVRNGNTIVNNTTDQTVDSGTDTYIETPAGGASSSEIADAVWDEVLTPHDTASSAAKILKDAKLKATLASLK